MLPIIGIGGQAGVGKDTVADMIVGLKPGTVKLAHSQPLKWLGFYGFDFTEEQLWGPSQNRNAVDARFSYPRQWNQVEHDLFNCDLATRWLNMVEVGDKDSLHDWFDGVRSQFEKSNTFSPRHMLQLLGTEYGRRINPHIWSEFAIKTAIRLLKGGYKYNQKAGLVPSNNTPPAPAVLITDLRFPNEAVAIKCVSGKILHVASESSLIADTHASEISLNKIPDFWWDVVINNNKKHGLEALKSTIRKVVDSLMPPSFVQSTKLFVVE